MNLAIKQTTQERPPGHDIAPKGGAPTERYFIAGIKVI